MTVAATQRVARERAGIVSVRDAFYLAFDVAREIERVPVEDVDRALARNALRCGYGLSSD